MDVLLIFLSIAGFVFAAVMLLLASRTTRMERESDARVEELQALATGSVLFASGGLAESDEASPLRLNPHDDALDLAWDEMVDETVEKAETARASEWTPEVLAEVRADVHAQSHPFVLNVPAAAGAGQVFSFARAQRRSRT